MNTVSAEHLYKAMQTHRRTNWYMYDGSHKNLLDYHEGADLQLAINQAEIALSNVHGRYVIFELWERAKGDNSNGGNTQANRKISLYVNLQSSSNYQEPRQNNDSNYIDLHRQIWELQKKMELEALEREIRELKAKPNSNLDLVLDKAIKAIIAQYSQPKAPGQPITQDTTSQPQPQPQPQPQSAGKVVNINVNKDEAGQKVKNAIKDFHQFDPENFADILEKLGDFVKKDPETARSLISNL